MRARLHELLLYALDHPAALLFAEATRRLGDVVSVPGVGTVVSDPVVARAILQDDRGFTKNGPGSSGAIVTQVMGEHALLNMEGEAHRALRRKLAELFSPAYLDVLGGQLLAEPVRDLGERLGRGETVDLVRFMRLLTGRTTCHMLGLEVDPDVADRTYLELYRAGEELTSCMTLTTRELAGQRLRLSRQRFERLTSRLPEVYARPDLRPGSVIARLRELGLSCEEARGVVGMLLLAGTATLTTAVPRAVALLADTGSLGRLRRDPGGVQSAIDEALRCIVPSPVMLRRAAADAVVAGHRFRAGQRVMILTYSLLKHPRHFPAPGRFDIGREPHAGLRNLCFGAGPHFCLGFGLAQREMRMVLEALLAVPGELRVRRRRYARGVLLPAYALLEVEARR